MQSIGKKKKRKKKKKEEPCLPGGEKKSHQGTGNRLYFSNGLIYRFPHGGGDLGPQKMPFLFKTFVKLFFGASLCPNESFKQRKTRYGISPM